MASKFSNYCLVSSPVVNVSTKNFLLDLLVTMVKGDLEDLLKRFPLQRRERLAPVPEPDEAIWAAPDPEETLEDGTHYVKE